MATGRSTPLAVAAGLVTLGLVACTTARADDTATMSSARPSLTTTTTEPAVADPTTSVERTTTTDVATTTTFQRTTTTTTDAPTTTAESTMTTGAPTSTAAPVESTPASAPPDTPLPPPAPTLPPMMPPVSPTVTDPGFPALASAFHSLVGGNPAVSVTVLRDHIPVFAAASGNTLEGGPMTADTPMVLASVSKLITSLSVARLVEAGTIVLDQPVPWTAMALPHDPAWDTVSVRELLGHTSGMPKAQSSWLDDPGSCAIPLTAAISRPPTGSRGTWLYSNGNYCALGLLIESVTGTDRGTAARTLVFDPLGLTGAHLTTDGDLPTDAPYAKGTARLERLGGAGTWMASTDDLAVMLDTVTADDYATMIYPATMADQYGWGHTGTVDGAKACAWVMDQGRTVVVGIVSGTRPSTGGGVCDVLIPAVAADLGIWADTPHRFPR